MQTASTDITSKNNKFADFIWSSLLIGNKVYVIRIHTHNQQNLYLFNLSQQNKFNSYQVQQTIMKERFKSRSHNKVTHSGPKAFFHISQPYCNQYLKLKQVTFEKSKQMRSLKKSQKQKSQVLYEFGKPKSGFYALKGCSIEHLEKRQKENQENIVIEAPKSKSQFLNYFLKKYVKRRQKTDVNETQQSQFPQIKYSQPYTYPSMYPCTDQYHCKSTLTQNCSANPIPMPKLSQQSKMKTEPVSKNKSWQYLQKKQRTPIADISYLANMFN